MKKLNSYYVFIIQRCKISYEKDLVQCLNSAAYYNIHNLFKQQNTYYV